MEIRRYDRGDLEAIVKLFYDTVHRVCVRDYSQEQVDAWATGVVDMDAWHRSFCAHHSLVAVDGATVVGFGDIDRTGYLDRLYVHHEYQRQGVASIICDRLEAAVKPGVTVRTNASITARTFFENRGYVAVKEQFVERHGVSLKNYVMELYPMEKPILNEHTKQEYPPMHTAEHLLNGEMARRYGHGRAFSAHIERKKSKLDYHLPKGLTDEELRSLEDYINHIVGEDIEVTEEFLTQAEAMDRFDMSRLPDGASDTLRVVNIGKYDQCLCAGTHVGRTGEIGVFRITSSRYENGVQRIVFKLGQ